MFDHGFPSDWSTLKKLIWLKGAGIIGGASAVWKTVTGTLIHITDALASPMQKCEVTLEPVQAGSGDPSPDNVRPITGWTGANIKHTGKNLFDESAVTFGKWISNAGVISDQNYGCMSAKIPVSGSTYSLTYFGSDPYSFAICEYKSDDTFIKRNLSSNKVLNPVTLDANTAYIVIFVASASSGSATMTSEILATYKMELAEGSTYPDSYEPFGTTYSVTFPALGKNLCNPDAIEQVYTTASNIRNGFEFSKPGTYVISASDYNSGSIRIKVRFADGTFTAASIISDSETKTYKKTSLQEHEAIIIYDNSSTNTIEQSKALF